LNVQASNAHVEPLHLPPSAQLKAHEAPSSHVAFGHTDPVPVQLSVHVEPDAHLTFHPPQSPPFEHEKTHVEPAGQVTSPEHLAPIGLQSKLHFWPAPHATFTPRQVPLFPQL
jgi:hypothetical protein